eukprot:scaffold10025_cov180-Amphora_coffeaeformis.AAC.2
MAVDDSRRRNDNDDRRDEGFAGSQAKAFVVTEARTSSKATTEFPEYFIVQIGCPVSVLEETRTTGEGI